MSFKKTLLFFFIFLFVSLPVGLFTLFFPVGKFNRFYADAPSFVTNLINKAYPADLVISIDNGNVSTNRKSPYCLILDTNTRVGIVFDQKADAAAFMGGKDSRYSLLCRPFVLVGKNFVVYPDTSQGNKGSYRVQQIPANVTYRITRAEIDKIALLAVPVVLNVGRKLYYAGPFVLAIPVLLLLLLANVWFALVALLFFKLTKISGAVTFKEAYSKSFFALFIYTVIDWVVFKYLLKGILGINMFISFPLLTTTIVVAITLLLEKYYSKKSA